LDIIRTEKLNKTYRQGKMEVHALREVDLALEAGEFAVVAGPSGSGKTTLLNLIGALDRPGSGTILFEGRDLARLSSSELSRLRRDRIGFVFQAYNLIPVLTAEENAEFVLLLQGKGRAERRARVRELLARVGLSGLERRRPAELSGGQQQRVAIVRALAHEPALVLADEPTANLDSKTAQELLDLMHGLSHDLGITFLFSSHDPEVVRRAERLITLRDGRIAGDVRQNP
jgi:putative ABC transport system ATP-binding protein